MPAGPRRARRLTTSVAVLLGLVLFSVGISSAFALNPERHLEMVSPLFKGGYGAEGLGVEPSEPAVAPDGESVIFISRGGFAEALYNGLNAYVASRTATGWTTRSLEPPVSVLAAPAFSGLPYDISPDLQFSLSGGHVGASNGEAELTGNEWLYLVHPTAAAATPEHFTVAGKPLRTVNGARFTPQVGTASVSASLSHLVFFTGSAEPLLEAAREADFAGAHQQPLYDLVTSGSRAGSLSLVDVDNRGRLLNPECPAQHDSSEAPGSRSAPLPAEGDEIFFQASGTTHESGCNEQVFVRLADQRTLEVSRPLSPACAEVPCGAEAATRASARFVGASEDGSRVFFTTTAPLEPLTDHDSTNDLYMASIDCPSGRAECPVSEREVTSMTQISAAAHGGEAADVQGVLAVAPDGSRTYFVAHGILSEGANSEGASPLKGGDNLYVAAIGGGPPVFIGALCSGPELSGEHKDPHCPSTLESDAGSPGNDSQMWITPTTGLSPQHKRQFAGSDARFLVFETFATLRPSDSDSSGDIYRYDAASGELDRVSSGEEGYDANGNDSGADSTMPFSRAVSEDGSRIVFQTHALLSPIAPSSTQSTLIGNYEWREQPGVPEGVTSFIAPSLIGNSLSLSSSGRDIFFITPEGLLPQDTDGAPDVYDARTGPGFSPVPEPRQPCAGDACQGALSNPAPLLIPGSASQAPGENLPADPTPPPAGKPLAKPQTRAQRLAKGLRACRNQHSHRARRSCERRAHKTYPPHHS